MAKVPYYIMSDAVLALFTTFNVDAPEYEVLDGMKAVDPALFSSAIASLEEAMNATYDDEIEGNEPDDAAWDTLQDAMTLFYWSTEGAFWYP